MFPDAALTRFLAVGGVDGAWLLIIIPAFLIVLFLILRLPPLLGKKRAAPSLPSLPAPIGLREDFVVWVAQGFGSGRVPFSPGTFGSLIGLLWFALLTATGSMVSFGIGLILGLVASVWFCGAAEKILQQKDPGSIVLDEIAAVPICFVPWVLSDQSRLNTWPSADGFFGPSTWPLTVVLFLLFRLFDIWKPWPIRHSQALPGGWGVALDDVLAGVFVALLHLATTAKG